MHDNRYPMMEPLDRVPAIPAATRRVAREVSARTGTNCFVNTIKGTLLFCYGQEPGGGPLLVKPHQARTTADADDMVRFINLGKIGRRRKDRIAASSEAMEAHDRDESHGVLRADRRHDVESYAGFLSRKRRGTATLISMG